MSYRIENEEMGFLNKVADELEKLEKEVKFLEVDIYDIPKATDRHPYHEESEADDYPFSFTYKGKDFDIYPSNYNEFKLEIRESGKSKETFKTSTFTMKERTPTLKKFWKDLLKEIEEKCDLKEQERYFFYKWCQRQRISGYRTPEEDKNCQAIYELLTEDFEPKEIEEMIEKRYKNEGENRIDRDVESELSDRLGIRFVTFFDGLRYFVLTKNQLFSLKTKESAFEVFQRESINALKENLNESYEKYKRVQTMIDEKNDK